MTARTALNALEPHAEFRHERKFVNAYWVHPSVPKGVKMASMADGLVLNPETYAEYQALVKRAMERGGLLEDPS